MKVKFWVYLDNLGDGSVVPRFFNSPEAAERYSDLDDDRFCDDIYFKELEFDEHGNLLTPNPIHYKER